MPISNEPCRIITVQQYTLTTYVNGVPESTTIDPATAAPSNDTNGSVGEERNATKREKEFFKNKYEASESVVAESKLCDTDNKPRNPTPGGNENIDAHKNRKLNHPSFNAENDKQGTPEQMKTQRRHLTSPGIYINNVNDEVVLRENML